MKTKILTALALTILLFLLSLPNTVQVLFNEKFVFAFNDGPIESALAPWRHYPAALFGNWDNQFFFGSGSSGVPLTTWSLLESLLGPHQYRRYGVLLAIWLTGLAGYWAARQIKTGAVAALGGAVVLMLCGWNLTFPMNGLTSRSFTLAWSLLSVGMIEKGLSRRHWIYYALAGAFLGMAVSDTPDVGILFSLCCAGYFVFTHFAGKKDFAMPLLIRHGAMFAVYIAVSIFVAWQMIGAMFETQISNVTQGDSEDPAAKYAWATQWSLPKSETWSLIACDFHGASSRSEESPYWGGMGMSEGWEIHKQGFRNFRLAGYAFGVVPFVIVAMLAVYLARKREDGVLGEGARRRSWILLSIAVVSLMLAWGRHFPLYKVFYQLPYMGTIRNPDKWLGPFSMCLGLAFAMGIDMIVRLRAGRDAGGGRRLMKLSAGLILVIPVIASATLTYLFIAKQHFINGLANKGYGPASEIIWQNAVSSSWQCLIVAVVLFCLLWLYLASRGKSGRIGGAIILSLIVCVAAVELIAAGRPFVIQHDYSYVLRPNVLTSFLDANTHKGRLALLPGRYPLFNNWRMTYLNAKDYYLFDPESVSRMPVDYAAFFNALKQNQLRLWQMGAVRYMLCTKDIAGQLKQFSAQGASFRDILSFGVAQDGGVLVPHANIPEEHKQLVLVEFENAMPLFYMVNSWDVFSDDESGDAAVLRRIAASDFNPVSGALVSGVIPRHSGGAGAGTGAITVMEQNSRFVRLKISSGAPAMLVRSVKNHSGWKAEIDGNPVKIHRVNYLFQGLVVPAGDHEVCYAFKPSFSNLGIAVAGRILILLGVLAACVVDRRSHID